jgi:hypothetical protein
MASGLVVRQGSYASYGVDIKLSLGWKLKRETVDYRDLVCMSRMGGGGGDS